MTEKWEMCEITSYDVTFYSPGEPKREIKLKEYLKSKGIKGDYRGDALRYILDDGWEPFATGYSSSQILFRRKYQG
jgi:hypothetical protein